MENMFKNFVYTGIGIVALTKEKVQKAVDKLVSNDKLSASEGKKIIEDFFKNTDNKRQEFETQLTDNVSKVVNKFRFATSKDVDTLNQRVATLEELVKQQKGNAKSEEV